VTSREEEYRRYARQCLEIAPTFQDEEARASLLGLAQAWLRLAHLAQVNRHIAELAVQVVRQRAIVKYARDTGQRSEMARSLLDALEGSLRIFEKAPDIFAQLQRSPFIVILLTGILGGIQRVGALCFW
jgi:hypothetical protein